jgi:hypothetical protein
MANNTQKIEPFSLIVNEAAHHFGFSLQTLYDWISRGKLHRGKHYLKIGKKVVIIRENFIKFMVNEDGSQVLQ